MSERLKDLQRQRALAQEQLAWLDREIARESGAAVPSPAPSPSLPAAGPPQTEGETEAILAQYRSDPRALQGDVKRGCFLYFFAAFGLVGLVVLGLYFLTRK